MSGNRRVFERQPRNNRSAIGNGTRLFVDSLDGRSALARRYRDLVAEHTSDLGGADCLSEAQRQLIRRSASLAVWCEAVEAKLAAGEEIDIGTYTTATNALRRVLIDLGLERRARDATPSIETYLALRAGASVAPPPSLVSDTINPADEPAEAHTLSMASSKEGTP